MLSLILFALGVGLISFLFLMEKQLDDNFKKNLAGIDLVIGAKGSPLQLILCNMYHVDFPTGNITLAEARPFLNPKHPLIDKAIPLSLGDNHQGYRLVGTTADLPALYEATLKEGKLWERNFEVTIGSAVANSVGLKIGDTFTSSHGFVAADDFAHDDEFKVVGIFETSGTVIDQLILTTTQSFWLVHEGHGQDSTATHDEHDHAHNSIPLPLMEEDTTKEITSVLVTFKGRNFQSLNMGRNINDNTDLQAASPAIEINRLFSNLDTGESALRILALVIIIVSGLSIFISLFSSLKDRKYELALLRVMGGKPETLFDMIILEGLILAFFGFLFGMMLSHIGMEITGQALKDSYRYDFTGWQFLEREILILIGALGLGLIAATIPAWQASRTDISETLSKGN